METKHNPIVVGTDFSQGSVVALEVAIDIANKLETDVLLIWVKKERKLISTDQVALTEQLAKERLQGMCDQYGALLKGGSLRWEVVAGKVASAISEKARQCGAPMIVVGTNGASGFEKYLIGSTAQRIVQESPCPTLTIREGFNFHKSLDHIVVPIRTHPNSRQKVPTAAAMARLFGAQVHVVGLIETAQDAVLLQTFLKQVRGYFEMRGIPCTCVGRRYESYAQTVLAYAEEVQADLLVINTEQSKPLAQLFLGTNAQQVVNRSQIPVLCVHPDDELNAVS